MVSLGNTQIKFFGVRGSCPIGTNPNKTYGGNTPCIGISTQESNILLDAGTGLCNAATSIDPEKPINIFLTHLHWDHIIGLPFFSPLYKTDAFIDLYAPRQESDSLEQCLRKLFNPPYFPVKWENIMNKIRIHELSGDADIILSEHISIQTINTYHDNNCLAYRVLCPGNTICYLTDIEYQAVPDREQVLKFVNKSDILIMDATYTPEEYNGIAPLPGKKGWGHSTWEDAANLARQAQVKQLFLFHHDICRKDDELKTILKKARNTFENTFIACEDIT